MKLFKSLLKKRNNKGYSLIETIVAMLVLAIIAIPLLTSLSMVTQINYKGRDKQYATAVASNIMEGLKEYGLSRVAVMMYGEKDDFKLATVADNADFGETLKDFVTVFDAPGSTADGTDIASSTKRFGTVTAFSSRLPKADTPENADYNSDYARKYYYIIKNVAEGTGTYDVRITYDATISKLNPAGGKINEYDLSDLSALNSAKTALLTPSGYWYIKTEKADGTESDEYDDMSVSFETKALEAFYERYNNYLTVKYADSMEKTAALNDLIYKAITSYIETLPASASDVQRIYDCYVVAPGGAPVYGVNAATSATWRKSAYDSYKTNHATEYQEYLDKGVILLDGSLPEEASAELAGPLAGMTDDQIDRYFLARINRKTLIDVAYVEEADTGKKYYTVKGSVVFELDQGTEELVCSNTDANKEDFLNYDPGYFYTTKMTNLQNIYLFQDAALKLEFASDTVILNMFDCSGKLISTGDSDSVINLYLVWQYKNPEIPQNNAKNLNLILQGDNDQLEKIAIYSGEKNPGINLFRQISPTSVLDVYSGQMSGSYVSYIQNVDRAYSVTVDVLEQGTNKVLTSIQSTIKE